MVIIGYQGVKGSFGEAAAKEFTNRNNFGEVKLKGCLTSKGVISSLLTDKVDFGIVETENSISGLEYKTLIAIKGIEDVGIFVPAGELVIQITYGLYNRSGNIKEVKRVIAHPSAIKQCKNSIKKRFTGSVKFMPATDTALSANYLSKGIYDSKTAVICSRQAAEEYGLNLLIGDLADSQDNKSVFKVYKKKDNNVNGNNMTKNSSEGKDDR